MPDWTKSMTRTFEYYEVDPATWMDRKQLKNVTGCTISRDSTADTLGSATIDIVGGISECYIRVYLITIQNGIRERFPLGTFLVESPSSKFDGKIRTESLDAYTPLIELKENTVPVGYYTKKDENVMENVYNLVREKARAPVVQAQSSTKLFSNFVAESGDTWLSYCKDLLSYNKYEYDLDEMGRILFSPIQEDDTLSPVWTFDDSNASILYPEITVNHDMYGIPNVVEVIYSDGKESYYARVVNDDANSPTSTVNRGREITYRETNPSLIGDPTQGRINTYANQLLKSLSTLEYTVTYEHGYCPVRPGDCVRLNYTRFNLNNIRARIISQSIHCDTACSVSEKARFISKLWEPERLTFIPGNYTEVR